MDTRAVAEEAIVQASEARGVSTLFDACAEALVNRPSPQVVADVLAVAHALGDDRFDGCAADEELTRRFDERFLVPSSPYFVALRENCLRSGSVSADALEYGFDQGTFSDHALRCYETVGFDHRALHGSPMPIATLHADSLATECAFLALLYRRQADLLAQGETDQRFARLADEFASVHLIPFARLAAVAMRRTPEDFYTLLVAFIRDSLELVGAQRALAGAAAPAAASAAAAAGEAAASAAAVR